MMKTNSTYNSKKSKEDKFFQEIDVPFSNSKEDAWNDFSKKIQTLQPTTKSVKIISMSFYRVAAAVLILVTCTTLYLKNIEKTILCEKGTHINHVLPDGSLVALNAASSISYHPYWWYFNREVLLDGEAFFNVKKGQKFSVISNNKITEVLGTSFNIYARNNHYDVFCKTGKVKVSNSKIELTIVPGELAILNTKNGKVEIAEEKKILSWQQNKFIYNATPLKDVFEEIERQYNTTIHVNLHAHSKYIFTGYFIKKTPIDSTIQMIGNRFNLQVEKNDSNQYIVSAKI